MVYSPLEQFSIISLLPFKFSGMYLSFSNSSFLTLIIFFVLIVFMHFGVFNAQFKPSRWQALPEMLYEFVLSIVQQNISKGGLPFFPMIFFYL
jgi:F0F1-type ATP synthase membrane subunit a